MDGGAVEREELLVLSQVNHATCTHVQCTVEHYSFNHLKVQCAALSCMSVSTRKAKGAGNRFCFCAIDAKESEKRALRRVSRFLMPDMREEAGQGKIRKQSVGLLGVGHSRLFVFVYL